MEEYVNEHTGEGLAEMYPEVKAKIDELNALLKTVSPMYEASKYRTEVVAWGRTFG